tara:strand:- start:14782 stop:17091 length:2310 start_codon:yes stop_codon:yes gene_type:complete
MTERLENRRVEREDLQFQEDIYEKCLRIFDAIDHYLGIKLYVHAEEGILEDGQIFLFNHFARFETVIPVYIFYQRLRKFTRTIADHELFNSNPTMDRILRGAGAVPNDMDGLLPFLAAELLKGHKVVIFPEGRMIKSKQVMDEEGQFGIFSQSLKSFRKHHTGAAVLALTLDLFKHRIKELFKSDDRVRLDHWCQALEFPDYETLRTSVEKPTLIVPGTITFSPIRISPNLLTRAAKLFSGELSNRTLEEIIIEGNILLKDTDMDIRFGEPIKAHHNWSWWEDRLVKSYFLSIQSLDDFFSLKKRSETWAERLLSRIIYRETNKIRDAYIKGIYQGVTLNVAHLASALIYVYLEQGRTQIDCSEFHQTLYYCVKELQKLPGIHMNNKLAKPESYRQLLDGKEENFKLFIKTARQLNLIAVDKNQYLLQDKLREKFEPHTVRLKNPVLVSANEIEPILAIKPAILAALALFKEHNSINLAYKLWDDELRDFAWQKEKFSKSEYDELNQHEQLGSSGEPYLLTHKESAAGVLLIHGFLASPPELTAYAEHLYQQGFNVLVLRLPGHGTSPYDLQERKWEEWYQAVERNYGILAAFSEHMYILGFSAGGALALQFSTSKPQKLKALATVCAAIRLQDKKVRFVSVLNKLNKLVTLLPKIDGIMNYKDNDTIYGATNYLNIPISALSELHDFTDELEDNLPAVDVPLIIVQSDSDPVVKPESAEIIFKKVSSIQKSLIWVKSDSHHILRNNIADTWAILDEFFNKQEENESEE